MRSSSGIRAKIPSFKREEGKRSAIDVLANVSLLEAKGLFCRPLAKFDQWRISTEAQMEWMLSLEETAKSL